MKELEQLKENDNVLCIVIFGSCARGEKYGDIDVLIITKEKEKITLPEIYDVFAYTLEEFKEEIYSGKPSLLPILIEGKAIKGESLWNKLKRLFYMLHKDKNSQVVYKGDKRYKISDLM